MEEQILNRILGPAVINILSTRSAVIKHTLSHTHTWHKSSFPPSLRRRCAGTGKHRARAVDDSPGPDCPGPGPRHTQS
jgi:hypothetical protein